MLSSLGPFELKFHSLGCWGANTASARLSRYSTTELHPCIPLSPKQILGAVGVDIFLQRSQHMKINAQELREDMKQ